MSAVVKAVVGVVEDVVEAVGDVVEDVVDVVEDVGNAIDDYVIQPILDDPVTFAVQVAAASVGIPPPVTAAAITAAKGGDIEDIGKAALVAAVAPEVGKAVGTQVAGAVANTGMNQTLQQTLVNATSSAAAGATSAAIQGGDIGATALLGAAGGAGGTLAGEAARGLDLGDTAARYAETAGRVAAMGGEAEDIGMALGQQAVGDITKSIKDRPKDGPMTREELADATYELLQEELAALEGREPREGVQVAEADMSDRPPLRIDIEGVGDMTSEPREGGPDEVPERTLPTVDVTADMDVGALTDAQLIDLVRAGQRRRQEAARPAEGAAAPAEGAAEPAKGEQVMPEVVVEADAVDDEISDEEILELVRLGMDRAEAPDEELPEGEMELGGGEGEGIPEGEMELGGGEGEGEPPVTPRVTMPPVVADRISRRGAASLTPRQVGQGYSAIVGDKEPTFGGDPGQQQEVWNQRSLRLRKALGL
jgi:hypothetical protein